MTPHEREAIEARHPARDHASACFAGIVTENAITFPHTCDTRRVIDALADSENALTMTSEAYQNILVESLNAQTALAAAERDAEALARETALMEALAWALGIVEKAAASIPATERMDWSAFAADLIAAQDALRASREART